MKTTLKMKNEPKIVNDCICYNCDCMDVMKEMPANSVDFILSDIPYDLNLNGGGGHTVTFAQESKSNHARTARFISCHKVLTMTKCLVSLSVYARV